MKYQPKTWSMYLFLPIIALVTGIEDGGDGTLDSAIRDHETRGSSNSSVLSRRKRFLTFPDGSSLQLVFCLQTSAVILIGDIFLVGYTAALAWELPKDPTMLLKDKGLMRRKDDTENIYYTDDKGKVLYKIPFARRSRPIVPVFAKRSAVDPPQFRNSNLKVSKMEPPLRPEAPPKIDRKRLHAPQRRREFLKREHMSESTVEFHRHSRKGLYEKLEVFLKALGMNGRQCLLRTLCEAGATSRRTDEEQGTIVEEMARAVFTLHHGQPFSQAAHREYDAAHSARECHLQYPHCHPPAGDLPARFD